MENVNSTGEQKRFEIVAEQKFGHWLAWFDECPQMKRAGLSAWSAITSLIAAYDWHVANVEIVEPSAESNPADGDSVQDPARPVLVLSVNSSSSAGIMDHVWELADDSFAGVNGPINVRSLAIERGRLGKERLPRSGSSRANSSRQKGSA